MSEAWDEKAVFLSALEKNPIEREAYLRAACPNEEAVNRIRTLLVRHAEASISPGASFQESSEPPPRIDEFEILSPLGEGGMGKVYLARDTVLNRNVALKVLAGHLVGCEDAMARFLNEARHAARLSHPAIVPVHKFGFDGRYKYIVSEYVEGETLKSMISKRRKSSAESSASRRSWHRQSAELTAVIADALECAHRAKIVHRDVKPSNILFNPSRGPRLSDFGIAKQLIESAVMEASGVIGTCHYMSPEQASEKGQSIDQRSDIFSLGVVLYELLSLERPFDGMNSHQVLQAIIKDDPPRLRSHDRSIPKELEIICHKAIEKHPAQRYQTAAHVAADLRCFLEDRPILAQSPSVQRRVLQVLRSRRRGVVAASLLALISLASMLIIALMHSLDEAAFWVSVGTTRPGYHAWAKAINPKTFAVDGALIDLGSTPIKTKLLTKGQYRVIVLAKDGASFCEYNVELLQSGRRSQAILKCYEANEEWSTGTDELSATLIPTPHVVEDMVFVPGGEYEYGWADSDKPLIAKRTCTLPAFYIDRFEVSNAEYKEFVEATGHERPGYWQFSSFDESLGKRPVVRVTMEDAEAYARWRGKRLPTALEWEASTRGTSSKLYPWGDEFVEEAARLSVNANEILSLRTSDEAILFGAYVRHTSDVDTFDPLASVNEVFQVFGNAEELTGSIDFSTMNRVTKGRSWADDPERFTLSTTWTHPKGTGSFVRGFRCAKSAVAETAGIQ